MKVVNVIKTSDGGFWIIPALETLRDFGHEVIVLVPDDNGTLGSRLREKNFTVQNTATNINSLIHFLNPREHFKLRRQIESMKSDVVVYQLFLTSLWCRISLIGIKARKVFQIPGPLFLESKILRIFERMLCKLDTFVICGSKYTHQIYSQMGVSTAKLSHTGFGVDLRKFSKSKLSESARAERREKFVVPSKSLLFIMVAFAYSPKKTVFRGRGVKGHEILISAWERFSLQYPDAYLIIVGDNWPRHDSKYRSKLEKEMASRSRKDSFRWLTGITDPRPYYEISDVSIAPSLSDNHGSVLEASSMGIPSIVSDAGALCEALPQSWTWVFESGNSHELYKTMELARNDFQLGKLPTYALEVRNFVSENFDVDDCSISNAEAIIGRRLVSGINL
jgi:glycosyltransferase involved in cell wall biosynthesis